MDIFAHALWTSAAGITANEKLRKPFRWPWLVLWGVSPDLGAFSPIFILQAWIWLFGDASTTPGLFNPALREALPVYLRPDELYHYTHSLVIFSAVFALIWLVRRRPVWVMLGWPMHILIDIPSHRAGMYGTPFLWPISSYRFNGISWARPGFMLLNYSALTVVYLALLIWLLSTRRKSPPKDGLQ